MLRSKRIIEVPKEFQISFHITTCPMITIIIPGPKHNELSILLGKHASLCVLGTTGRQYIFNHNTLDITAKIHAVFYIPNQASLNSLTI